MERKDNLLLVILFAFLIGGIALGGLLTEDKGFSANENRGLQQWPQLTIEHALSGDFEKRFQQYQDDQILGRDGWIRIKTAARLAVGSRDINDVYIGKDGYLMERHNPEEIEEQLYHNNLKAVNGFFQGLPAGIKSSLMLVPSTGMILKDKLPPKATMLDEVPMEKYAEDLLGDDRCLNLYTAFQRTTNQKLYYKTDHHWTTHGAYIAYRQWMKTIYGETVRDTDYPLTPIARDFRGSLYSKVLRDDGTKDTVCAYRSKQTKGLTVYADGKDIGGIYQMDFTKKKDKYAIFFGGNYGKVKISGGAHNGRNLLIIKDSFANSFAPFVGEQFETVHLVDLRYFSGNLAEYITTSKVTDVLVLYSMVNMASDKNIGALNSQGIILQ